MDLQYTAKKISIWTVLTVEDLLKMYPLGCGLKIGRKPESIE
jgi:hypothetical protein